MSFYSRYGWSDADMQAEADRHWSREEQAEVKRSMDAADAAASREVQESRGPSIFGELMGGLFSTLNQKPAPVARPMVIQARTPAWVWPTVVVGGVLVLGAVLFAVERR